MLDIFYYDGRIHQGTVEDLANLKDKKVWVDAVNISRTEAELLRKIFDLHPLTEEDIYNTHVRIKVEEFPNYLFCAFYGLRRGKSIEPVELDYVLGENFVISNHERDIPSYNELKTNAERLEAMFGKGCDFIFHKLLDDEVDHYYPVLETFDEQIEELEEDVTNNPSSETLSKILRVKRQIVTIKKLALPQRDKISMLTRGDYRFISDKAAPYFRDIHDHAVRVSEAIENYREAVSSTFEAYMSAVNNRLSEIMKVMSVIATIMMPLTVVSSIYGTNFINLPGSQHPYGFWVMIGIMLTMSGSIYMFLRSRHWF